MPPQPPEQKKKLVAYVGIVVGLLAVILALNVKVHDRTTTTRADGAGAPLRAGLERLNANPTKCAMTMEPSPDNERPMRHVNASIRGKVDVLVLGQSDADHMSQTFFKDDVRFYNGFISNSYFVYQYELFLDLMEAHGAPSLVLFDVRSGYILRDAQEPDWDTPAKDPVWWGFPPFHLGQAAALPWYKNVPSLLSLAQTELTIAQLQSSFARKPPPDSGDTETDIGTQFRCVSQETKSKMYRWMADGSRIYVDELHGVFTTPGPYRADEAVGERHVGASRLVGLDFVIRKLKEAGTKVIVYSPPLNPRAYEDPKQAHIIGLSGTAIRKVTEEERVDYCDLSLEGVALGCVPGDYADEHHISRHCDQRVVRELTRGCAPRAGALLTTKLTPATLQ